MKRRIAIWVLRRLARAARKRGAGLRATAASSPYGKAAAGTVERLLAGVWPWLDTPANRARGERFVSRMRSATARRA